MKEEIISHILIKKDDVARKESIEKYIGMAGSMSSSYVKDPFDRAIALTFELVMEEQLDPWDIDLASFSKMYLKRVKHSGMVDLITVGRIILMAWKVLKLQSDRMVNMIEENVESEKEWGEIPDWYMEDDGYLYTRAVIEKGPRLEEKVRRKGERKVTLVELINAFEEARSEINVNEKRRKARGRERERLAEWAEREAGENAHQENIEEEINIIIGRLSNLNGRAMAISEICNEKDKEEMVMTLSSLLFLARENRITMWQENFPYGTIYVKNVYNHEN